MGRPLTSFGADHARTWMVPSTSCTSYTLSGSVAGPLIIPSGSGTHAMAIPGTAVRTMAAQHADESANRTTAEACRRHLGLRPDGFQPERAHRRAMNQPDRLLHSEAA